MERHRDAETWAIHLMDLGAQGLHPDYTLADGARGLRAGQTPAWPDVPCQSDVFHALRDFTKVASQLEKRAYASIAKRTAIEAEMQKASERKLRSTVLDRLGTSAGPRVALDPARRRCADPA